MSDVVTFPGVKLTPEILLHQTLETVAHIKGLVMVIHWENDKFEGYWTSVKTSDLCAASMLLNKVATDRLLGEDADDATVIHNAPDPSA